MDYLVNIEKVRDLIAKVDIAPKQIIIEAKIIDITSSDLKALGVTWNFDYLPTQGGLLNRKTRAQEELQSTFTLNEQSSAITGGQLAINTLVLKGITIGATLDALISDGKANLLASPSIAVLNGQEARIAIGERFPYKERTQTTSGTTETTKFVDIGTNLRVSAQINDDGYITLKVHPEVSSLLASLDAGPRITTREADTTVRIKEGETLVIGGLIKQSDNETRDRIPILGDLPLIGAAFRRTAKDKEQTELAVFITPNIIFSQEEKLALGRKGMKDDAKVLINQTGKLSVVQNLFQKAKELDAGSGLSSVRKDEAFTKSQALSYYELIYLEFPDCIQAPEARYRAGMLYWKYYKDTKKAKQAFEGVASD